jgi:hypothetical protein
MKLRNLTVRALHGLRTMLLLMLLACPAALHAAEQRVALVIGNNAYPAAPLKNTINDARAMARTLNQMGFEVILRTNLNQKGMVEALREFSGRLREGGVALFYFSGHGMQVKGRNYLIPVDADIRSEDEVPYMSMDMSQVLDRLEAARSRANLVILDACRNNPFVRTFRSARSGLAQMDAPGGTLLAFATAPGSEARDGDEEYGVYTKHLLAQMSAPMVPVEVMFRRVREGVAAETMNRQIPWEASSLTGDFFFNASAPAAAARPAPAPKAAAAPAGVDPLAVELAFWNSIKDSTNPADFQAYLDQYPAGSFAALARNRVASAPPARAAAPVAVPAAPAPAKPAATKGMEIASRAPDAAAVRAAGPAALNVGDRWTYRFTDERNGSVLATLVHEITEVGAQAVTETLSPADRKTGGVPMESALDIRVVEHNAAVPVIEFAPFLSANTEITVGKTWSDIPGMSSMSSSDRWRVSARVTAREAVRVPAGEFNAYRVEVEAQRPQPTDNNDRITVVRVSLVAWYAPETRRVVKTVRKSFNQFSSIQDTDRYELVDFKLR